MERKPLSPKLNEMVGVFAARTFPFGYAVHPAAPNTWAEVRDELVYGGRMSLWAGDFGRKSVFADDESWRAFRAWHDWVHVRYNFCFTPRGEYACAAIQALMMYRVFGRSPVVTDGVAIALAEQLDPLERDWQGEGAPIDDRYPTVALTWTRWKPLSRFLAEANCFTEAECRRLADAVGAVREQKGVPLYDAR